MKTLKDFKLKDKYVLLRSDLNSDARNGVFTPSIRIKEAATTVKTLQKRGAKVVILAHQGTVGNRDFISLKKHSIELSLYCKVKFVGDIFGKKAKTAIKLMKSGDAVLLENVRFENDEFKPRKKGNKFLGNFASMFDLYVNDSFSVSHRDHTSITGFPRIIKSCAGPLVLKETRALEKLKLGRCLFILGGGKPKTNVKLLGKGRILAGGYFANMTIISSGQKLGKKNEFNKEFGMTRLEYHKILSKIKRKGKEIVNPVDFAVELGGKRKEFMVDEFPLPYHIKDIGEKTIKNYVAIIKKIKKYNFIYMKGPMGFANESGFSRGTIEILKAISKSKGHTIVGGGHLSDAIVQSKIAKSRFSHVSLSGGALLNYIAGEKLPGLRVLGYY